MAEIFGYVDTDQAIRNVYMMRTKRCRQNDGSL